MHHGLSMRLVVIPQAMQLITPPLTSQYLNIVQEFLACGVYWLSRPRTDFRRHGSQPNAGDGAGDGDHHGGLSAHLACGRRGSECLQRALCPEGTVSVEALAYVRKAPEPEKRRRSYRVERWPGPISFVDRIDLVTLRPRRAVAYLLPQLAAWATTRAIWSASDGAACRQHQDGAVGRLSSRSGITCGSARLRALARRCNEAIGAALIIWLLWISGCEPGVLSVFCHLSDSGAHSSARLIWLVFECRHSAWGGIFVSLLTAIVYCFFLPLGVLLALGRRSPLPAVAGII